MSEIQVRVDFDRQSEDLYSATMDEADYSHMSCHISMNENMKVQMGQDPNAFVRLLMHELLHYHTGSVDQAIVKNWDSIEYQCGKLSLTLLYNQCVGYAEQNTIRLERAFINSLWKSQPYKQWKKLLNAKPLTK